MKYIVIDLEMHPIPNKYKRERNICKQETIEIGAVALDESYEEISSFKAFVKPQFCTKIYAKYEKLTGISTEMLKNAEPFEAAFKTFTDWCYCQGEVVKVIAWSDNDFGQVIHEIKLKKLVLNEHEKNIMVDWYNFQKEFSEILKKRRQLSLDLALVYADIPFEGRRHDALWDARNTAKLYSITRNPEAQKQMVERAETMFVTEPLTASLGEMFNFNTLLT